MDLSPDVSAQLSAYALSFEQIEQLRLFADLLENAPLNLTALRGENLWIKGILDALSLRPYLPISGKFIDIGSGGGFPALVLAITGNDQQHWTLIDSRKKRMAYVQKMAQTLQLTSQIKIVADRAEEWIFSHPCQRQAYDAATARAVGSVGLCAELALPYVKTGGRVILPKGKEIFEETAHFEKMIEQLGGKMMQKDPRPLIESEHPRWIGVIQKQRPTPKFFPRRGALLGKPLE
ncbi:MAG: 16S rRNA (guanine(527)-N(7))-methyltransferase RsmG [Firmicutes bacterium]|nr:16S rRNA (guanine(527)-N(7))-methyltransferase RsmG [Bacillota bacterium]